MSGSGISPGDDVTAYGILLAVGFLAVLGVVCILVGLKWLGRKR